MLFRSEDIKAADGTWRTSRPGETESIWYVINQLPGRLGQPVVASEPMQSGAGARENLEFYLRPRRTGAVAGLPVYENAALVIARDISHNGRDPWMAVPLGRALKAAMSQFEKDRQTAEARLADLKKKNDEVQSAAWEQQKREQFEKTNGELRTSRPSN